MYDSVLFAKAHSPLRANTACLCFLFVVASQAGKDKLPLPSMQTAGLVVDGAKQKVRLQSKGKVRRGFGDRKIGTCKIVDISLFLNDKRNIRSERKAGVDKPEFR